MAHILILGAFILTTVSSWSTLAYDWKEAEPLPREGLPNPLRLSKRELQIQNRAGRFHGLNYPVEITGTLIPYHPAKRLFNRVGGDRILFVYEDAAGAQSPFPNFDEFLAWTGLHKYPEVEGQGPYFLPFTKVSGDEVQELPDRLGLGWIHDPNGAKGFTVSCAGCHSAKLFGKVVLGLQTRFPRANEAFLVGGKAFRGVPTSIFKFTSGADDAEAAMYDRSRENMRFVESKDPVALGLDTSLAHTALSLSHREDNEIAEKTRRASRRPRRDPLRKKPGDSKPGTWWNVKYKNRWLLDGSLVSGNPIYTNILWNEIGRGTDLLELEAWLEENKQIIDELTTAVYQSEAPPITDFFPAKNFDLLRAKRGQNLFRQNQCTKCHGDYIKNWEIPSFQTADLENQLKTHEVKYFEDTPVKNVGTDPYRFEAMASLTQLNDLRISKANGILIKPSKGYVPPPLVGIWARWPYLHNNSIPNLCALLMPEEERPVKYYSGAPINPATDYDFECGGYPVGEKTPKAWKMRLHKFDTRKKGMSNKGHSKRVFNERDRKDLVHFLLTL